MNYHSKKREIKRLKKSSKKKHKVKKQATDIPSCSSSDITCTDSDEEEETVEEPENIEKTRSDETPWEQHGPVETKSREEEMEDYLNDLLL